jgi:hypothetical protein
MYFFFWASNESSLLLRQVSLPILPARCSKLKLLLDLVRSCDASCVSWREKEISATKQGTQNRNKFEIIIEDGVGFD